MAPATGGEATVVVIPGTCGSSVFRSGPTGNSTVAIGTPAAITCSNAPAMPTESFGATMKPAKLPPASTSSIWLYCTAASNLPSKISVS